MSDSDQPSSGLSPKVIVLGIVALSVILFFTFTIRFLRPSGSEGASPEGGSQPSPVATAPAGDPGTGTAPAVKPADPAPATTPDSSPTTKPEPTTSEFSSAEDVALALAKTVNAGDLKAALSVLGEDVLDDANTARLEALVKRGGFRLASQDAVEQIGRFDSTIRYAIRLERKATDLLPAENKELFVDVERAGKGKGWTVVKLGLPSFSALAAKPDDASSTPSKPAAATDTPAAAKSGVVVIEGDADEQGDPLMLAHEFVDAILRRDFEKAKSLVDLESVTEEKLAGLLIVTEEGQFQRKVESPLIATAARDDSAWVIAQMSNAESGADFGLEIVRDKDGDWKIAALNLDSLLSARAKVAAAGEVPYNPIIENPQGGDSLVVFFAYDDSDLHDRGRRQLQILADILKSDPAKTITINGHTDALGSSSYNKGLSNARATTVRKGLLANGVPESQIVTHAYGETKPLRPNFRDDGSDDPEGRQQNRRAEVYLNF